MYFLIFSLFFTEEGGVFLDHFFKYGVNPPMGGGVYFGGSWLELDL